MRFDPTGNVLFISDDAAGSVFVVRAGPDTLFGGTDDVVTAIDTASIGNLDTEDPVYDPVSGHLFILDGMGTEVYRVDPADGVFGNGNEHGHPLRHRLSRTQRLRRHGARPEPGTLYVGTRTTDQIFEVAHRWHAPPDHQRRRDHGPSVGVRARGVALQHGLRAVQSLHRRPGDELGWHPRHQRVRARRRSARRADLQGEARHLGFSYRVYAIEGESPTIGELRAGMDAMR